MKRIQLLLTAVVVIGLSGSSWAYQHLHDRGNGMIYDDLLGITWMADGNYAKTSGYDTDGAMSWYAAKAWAQTVVFKGYGNWRLPTIVELNSLAVNCGISTFGQYQPFFNFWNYNWSITEATQTTAYFYSFYHPKAFEINKYNETIHVLLVHAGDIGNTKRNLPAIMSLLIGD